MNYNTVVISSQLNANWSFRDFFCWCSGSVFFQLVVMYTSNHTGVYLDAKLISTDGKTISNLVKNKIAEVSKRMSKGSISYKKLFNMAQALDRETDMIFSLSSCGTLQDFGQLIAAAGKLHIAITCKYLLIYNSSLRRFK